MRTRTLCSLTLLTLPGLRPASPEPSACFRTTAEAAAGAGVHDDTGYYLVVVRPDRLTGRAWAAVARCGQPQLPVSLVRIGERSESTMVQAPQSSADAEPKVMHVRVNRLRQGSDLLTEVPRPAPVQTAPAQPAPAPLAPIVLAGRQVRLLWDAGSARGEMSGTAMANGGLGQRVQVRMAGLMEGAQQRTVSGTVQADGTLILEAGR